MIKEIAWKVVATFDQRFPFWDVLPEMDKAIFYFTLCKYVH